ncbi:winged helix-turn-helix domain-containing protein [Gemmatimonadota bacterium]
MNGESPRPEGESILSGLDRVIHEPARMLITSLLSVVAQADFLFLMSHTGLTAGNLSSHVSKLETAGYVKVEKRFVGKKQNTRLSLTDKGRKAFEEYRSKIQELLDETGK